MLVFLFPIALFLSAFLLFSIQPMVAKSLLPLYGGTPAVWTVCMLFFQMILLMAYTYAWLLSLIPAFRVRRLIHTVLVLLSLFSISHLFHPVKLDNLPEWSILYNLLTELGVPLLVIAASSSLLQFVYSQSLEKSANDPYFLYVASNLGSLIALILYPWLIERFIGLSHQFYAWHVGYGIHLLLLFIILYCVPYTPLSVSFDKVRKTGWGELFLWVCLAFVPCSLMMGVTVYITTDVAATPLFWVLPLALYLFSFVISFSHKPLISPRWVRNNCVFFLIFTVVSFILSVNQVKVWQVIVFNVLSFFMIALLCHRELYERRPKPQELTLFYFCLALGGMLAGIFNGLLARFLFNQIYEYPIVILLSLLVIPSAKKKGGLWVISAVIGLLLIGSFMPNYIAFGLVLSQIVSLLALIIVVVWQQNKATLFLSMSCLFLFIFLPSLHTKGILLQKRSFYAVNRVLEMNDVHVFLSQSTVHGLQWMSEKKPLNGFRAYYGAIEPIVMALKEEFRTLTVTLLGLGTGTMVCQFRENDVIKVIEIDQTVIDIAKNTQLFTYLRDCPPAHIIKNDGRLAMENLPDASQTVLVLDAFNSDAIPIHLLTLEAFRLYKRKLSADGVILVNLSNRHLRLLPVINAMGRSLDFMTFHLMHTGDKKLGQFDSDWALLTANERLVPKLTDKTGWRFVADDEQFLWTDDYSNILPLIKW